MAKTFTNLTVANATAGNAILASDHSAAFTTLNNHTVPPMATVYRAAALSQTSSSAYQAISWDAQEFTNTDSIWTSGAATRLTLSTAGIYLVVGQATFINSATGLRVLRVDRSGSAYAYGCLVPGNSVINYINVAAMVESDGSHYVELAAYQDTGGSLAYIVGAASMRFSAVFVGKKA